MNEIIQITLEVLGALFLLLIIGSIVGNWIKRKKKKKGSFYNPKRTSW
jgi:hypothetical protein